MTHNDFIKENGKLDVEAMLKAAIRINRKGQVDLEDLDRIRAELVNHKLALEFLGNFLKYARELVNSSIERLSAGGRRVQFRDLAFAEVSVADHVFIFIAAEQHPRRD